MGQRLGRLATVGAEGVPPVAPVGFRPNPELETIESGGHDLARTKKDRDAARDGRVGFVVDDLTRSIPRARAGSRSKGWPNRSVGA